MRANLTTAPGGKVEPSAGLHSKARTFAGFPDDIEAASPPFQVAEAEMLVVGLRWPQHAAEALLPAELKAVPGFTGVAYVFGSDVPGRFTPFSCCFLAIEVEGFNSSDGSPGHYIVAGNVSGGVGALVRRYLNGNFLEGAARRVREGDVVRGAGGPPGVEAMRLALQPASLIRSDTTGIHDFLGPDPKGEGLNVYSVAFSGPMHAAVPLSVDVVSGWASSHRLPQPAELLWALYSPGMNLTYSAPRRIVDLAERVGEAARVLLIDAFSRLGKPAAIVERDGLIVTLNEGAQRLVADGVLATSHGRLVSRQASGAALFNRLAPQNAVGVEAVSQRVAFDSNGGRRVLAQAIALDPMLAGPDKVLILLSDPVGDSTGDMVPALQLLGLTPAEARVAGLVGAGKSPKEAADQLELTINTVRSALKVAFDKLGISRQSELAKIVTRLAG